MSGHMTAQDWLVVVTTLSTFAAVFALMGFVAWRAWKG